MPVRRLVGISRWRTGPSGPASPVEPDCARTPRHFGAGRSCADSKAATFCVNLLALYPALWLFAAVEGVEPTNNHAKRILRLGVLWRKNAFGCHNAARCRFVERMLTVIQTLRLQKRPVLDNLHRAIVARRGQPSRFAITGPCWGLNGYNLFSRICRSLHRKPESALARFISS